MFLKRFKNLVCVFALGLLLASASWATVLSSGQLNNPYKIVVANGSIYSVDTSNSQIKKFDASGGLVWAYGSFGTDNGQFNQPQGITADSKGYIYIVDTGNQRIQKLYDSGSSCSFVESISNIPELTDPTFSFPRSINVNDAGEIFIVDSAKNRVVTYKSKVVMGGSKGGVSASGVGSPVPAELNAPYGSDIDQNNCVFVADTQNHKIKKYSAGGKLLLEFGSQGQGSNQLLYPFGVAVDQNGNIYVADTGNHRVQKFSQLGKYITSFNDNKFFAPRGVSVGSSGYLYVVGADNKIQRLEVFVRAADLILSQSLISPNGDGVKDQVGMRFSLSEPALVDIAVYDSSGTILVKKLVDAQRFDAGENQVVWFGNDNDNQVVTDGAYMIKISGKSVDGLKDIFPVSANVEVDTTAPELTVLDPNVSITQEGSDISFSILIPYGVSESSEVNVALSSKDDGELYKAIETVSDISQNYEFIWYGTTGAGEKTRLRREYSFDISARDLAGNVTEHSRTFISDGVPPEINNVRISKPIFSPIANYPTEISFDISDNIFNPLFNLKIEVRDNNNELMKVVLAESSISAGHIVAAWDGRASDGKIVPDGIYQVVISVEDGVGNKTERLVDVETDTLPPVLSIEQNLYAFSPNRDGKYEQVVFVFNSNETGVINSTIFGDNGENAGNYRISAEADLENKIEWLGLNGFSGEKVPDGSYSFVSYAIDRAGNESSLRENKVIVDTTPPTINELTAVPNPFTPNDDGVRDTTSFSYQFSEPAFVRLQILSESANLFRRHEGPTENFIYPTVARNRDVQSQVPSLGQWLWDGRGSHNELLGGEYRYSLEAEDWVGNITSSEVKTIVVDRIPTLVPYAFAEPDPFSPVNPANNFTEIKYYLGRDNLKVKVWIIGQEGKTVKTLVNNEVQAKGEHAGRWYGDFESGYVGPTASKDKYRVADGSYEFKVYAEDLTEAGAKPAEVSNTVLVDNVAPHIFLKGLTVNYETGQANLDYSLVEGAKVEVLVLDENGGLLTTLVDGDDLAAGDYSASYTFEEVEYNPKRFFQVKATDRAKNSDQKSSELFAVQPGGLMVQNHQAKPAVFTPNGDGHSDLVNISYSITGGAPDYKVSLHIFSESGATVKRIFDDETQGTGAQSFYWDGKDDSGKYLLNGEYEYAITAQDKMGIRVTGQGAIMLISTRPTVDLSLSDALFSPNGDGAEDTTTLTYSISYPQEYITGEALVKLEILNSSSEAVWEKTISHTAGTYTLEWEAGLLGGSVAGNLLPEGQYYVRVSGEDALGTLAIPQTVALQVDYAAPEPSDFTIEPAYAKLGDKVLISLDFPEQLSGNPLVSISKANGKISEASLESVAKDSYVYSYAVGAADAEGLAVVSVEAWDLAQNQIIKTKAFMIDKTNPTVSNLDVSPNPASVPSVSGQVSIKFNVNEALKQAPTVYVTQTGAPPRMAVVGGEWEAKYDPVSGSDGLALATIEVIDLAGNVSVYSYPDFLTINTTAPAFSDLRTEISTNPDFSKFAQEGTTATIRFNTSEDLKFNPEVKVNGNAAAYFGLESKEYIYQYEISSTDTNGTAEISVSGYDLAGNEGAYQSATTPESFVIDLINPIVEIAPSGSDLIASVSPFSTNSDPLENRRSTALIYKTSEYGFVTVKVYNLGFSQDVASLTKDDFSSANLVDVLVAGVWQSSGDHDADWNASITYNKAKYDLDNNNLADPGKYAFIVEVRDRAGNVTERKWGGTVWVQDNRLRLKGPDQRDEALKLNSNPDPSVISPHGNATAEAQKRARLFFRVDLGITPQMYDRPERIEAMATTYDGISWETTQVKRVGYYSVNIYNQAGALIRTIANRKELYSGSLISEIWDGKNSAGAFVADGTYHPEVLIEDFLGAGPVQNILELEDIIVDNTPPVVSNLSVSPYYFSPGATPSLIKHTTLEYQVSDSPNNVNRVTVGVYREGALIKSLTAEAEKSNGAYNQTWDGSGPTGYVGTKYGGAFSDGVYSFKVSATDQAGNVAEIKTTDVVVDTIGPIFGSAPELAAWQKDNISLVATVSDETSNVETASYKWADSVATPGGVWTPLANSQTITQTSNGTWYLHVQGEDSAGNVTTDLHFGPYQKDSAAPTINPPAYIELNPYPNNSAALSFTVSDNGGCGIKSVNAAIKWEGMAIKNYGSLGATGNYTVIWNGKNDDGHFVNDGNYTLEIIAVDQLGQSITSSSTIKLWDEYKIVDTPNESRTPRIGVYGTNVHIAWMELEYDEALGGFDYKLYYKKSLDNGTTWGSNIKLGDLGSYGNLSIAVNNDNIHILRTRFELPSYYSNLFYLKSVDNGETWKTEKKIFNYASRGSAIAVEGEDVYAVWSFSGYGIYYSYSSDNGETWPTVFWPESIYCLRSSSEECYFPSIAASRDNVHVVWGEKRGGIWHVYYRRSVDRTGHWSAEQELASNLPQYVSPVVKANGNNIFLVYYKADGLYIRRSTNNGSSWEPEVALSLGLVGKIGAIVVDGANVRIAWTAVSAGDSNWRVYYKLSADNGATWSFDVRLPFRTLASPWESDIDIGGSIVYSVWEDQRDGNSDIYFQNIPAGFAPIEGTPTALGIGSTILLFPPTLISPANSSSVTNIRPTFKWQHRKGSATEYKLYLAKTEGGLDTSLPFTKPANTGSQADPSNDPDLYNFTYAIHEFDPGLDRDTYYWKVTAVATNEVATCEAAWSFTVTPSLTLTGVTNYPNPFNPNRETTSIRYRLGSDAEDVTIRIYDITGALVKEIPHCASDGEGSSVWQKYNDVDWDGKNGRGDKVVNGIYPFEVIAKNSGQTISGRGKIAVLK